MAICAIIGFLIAAVWLAVYSAHDMSRTVYSCPECSGRFRAPAWKYLVNGYYTSRSKVMTCPHCHRRCECVVSCDQQL